MQLDDAATPLLVAVGRAVFGVAALENALLLEAARLIQAQHAKDDPSDRSLAQELADLERLTGRQLLWKLRSLGLPQDLDRRIDQATEQRNDLVHHMFEDAELVSAVAGEGDLGNVITRIDRLALDCGEIATELEAFALPKLLELTDMSAGEVVKAMKSIDPTTLTDPRDRKRLEAIQAFTDIDQLPEILADLGIMEPTTPHPPGNAPED